MLAGESRQSWKVDQDSRVSLVLFLIQMTWPPRSRRPLASLFTAGTISRAIGASPMKPGLRK